MIKFIPSAAVILVWICCVNPYSSEAKQSRYLKPPTVQWNGNRLTGELKKVPVSSLLVDLVRSNNFDCDVSGQLPGTISISFENLTIEEIIHRIMRGNNYNYTLLSTPASADTKDYPSIAEIAIYKGDSIITFTRVPIGTQIDQMGGKAKHIQPPSPAPNKVPDSQTSLSGEHYAKQKKKLDGVIKGFLDEMLESKEMSKAEYEKALADMYAHTKEYKSPIYHNQK